MYFSEQDSGTPPRKQSILVTIWNYCLSIVMDPLTWAIGFAVWIVMAH